MFVLFWYALKEETHSYTTVQNKHTLGVYFSSLYGLQQPPSWLDMLRKIAWLDEG